MANETMTLIGSITVGSGGASELKFTSIPATFTDLMLVYSLRTAYSAVYQLQPVYFNNDSSNQTGKNLFGSGSGTGTNSAAYAEYSTNANTSTANTFSSGVVYIPNYASTTTYKTFTSDAVVENNATSTGQDIFAGLWASNAAINIVQLWGSGQTYQQYSTASLYGITKGSGGATVS